MMTKNGDSSKDILTLSYHYNQYRSVPASDYPVKKSCHLNKSKLSDIYSVIGNYYYILVIGSLQSSPSASSWYLTSQKFEGFKYLPSGWTNSVNTAIKSELRLKSSPVKSSPLSEMMMNHDSWWFADDFAIMMVCVNCNWGSEKESWGRTKQNQTYFFTKIKSIFLPFQIKKSEKFQQMYTMQVAPIFSLNEQCTLDFAFSLSSEPKDKSLDVLAVW